MSDLLWPRYDGPGDLDDVAVLEVVGVLGLPLEEELPLQRGR